MSKELLKLPTSTAVERIYAASLEEADGSGPGLAGLSPADRLINQQLETAYSLLLNYKTFEQCWPLLAKQFKISRATCYRRLADAMNLMGDLSKVKKQAARAMLIQQAQQLKQLCLEKNDMKNAVAWAKLEVVLRGLNKADTGTEEGAATSVSTSYNIYLDAPGKKPRVIDVNKLDNVSDAEYELIEEAVQQNVFTMDQMATMLADTRALEGASDARG